MIYTNIYLRLATIGLFISPIISFPQDAISFGGTTDDVKVKTDSETDCPEFCIAEEAPVCGTDRTTYSNSCKLQQTACHSGNNNLKIAHEGECTEGSGEREDENIDVKTRTQRTRNCCCVHVSSSCPNPRDPGFNRPNNGGSNSGFLSAASPRFGPEGEIPDGDIGSRIVNRPTQISQQQKQQEFYCESNERACCYDSSSTLSNVVSQSRCLTRSRPTTKNVFWSQQCSEPKPQNIRRGEKRCGERRFRDISGKKQGQANPAEFPWTCLVLDQNNNFIGSCAIIPDNRFNDVRSGTDRVIMAAHKLKDIRRNDQVKIRVIEYDASGHKQTENNKHQEYQVDDIVIHPSFDRTRLSHDIAVLKVVTRPDGFGGIKGRIDLTSTDDINAACLPGCNDQFNYQFSNGTGVRCWVAGWGKDGKDGRFQVIQNKVDVPLMRSSECQGRMKTALGRDGGRNFQLSESEICAGGEEGKDACDGDGGAPLVCQSKDNRWNVVGLVTWGVDCARKGVPGVYANVYNMLDFILRA